MVMSHPSFRRAPLPDLAAVSPEIDMAFPELTREQLLARCDLAGAARVVAVGRASADEPNLATLSFESVARGPAQACEGYVYVKLRGDGGAWTDWWDYPVGALVMTHLDWSGPDGLYQTTWPGAVWELDRVAVA
jgi:hypothetical protein